MGGAYRLGEGAGEGELLSLEEVADDGDELAAELLAAGKRGLHEDVEVGGLFAGVAAAELPLPGARLQRLSLHDAEPPDPSPDRHRLPAYTIRSRLDKEGDGLFCATPAMLSCQKGTRSGKRCVIDEQRIRRLLENVAAGGTDVDAALDQLRHLPYEDLGFAKIDHHRALRGSLPEVVLGQGKTPEQIVAIAERLVERSGRLLVTRIDARRLPAVAGARSPTPSTTRSARAATVDRHPRQSPERASACSAPAPPTCRWPRRRRSRRS